MASRITLFNLKIYTPTTSEVLSKDAYELKKVPYNASKTDDYAEDNYLHFPLVLNNDGTQWLDANRYLLYKVKKNYGVNHKTLASIADDLRHFKQFCDESDVDYLSAPRKSLRPTWLYRKYLMSLVRKENASLNTVKRRLSNITGFYDWLVTEESIKFKYSLWVESITLIHFKDDYGFTGYKKVKTKDVAQIRQTKNPDLLSNNTILDGGSLRPLPKNEQYAIMEALREIGNTEMTLGFLVALSTGARIQTVFTLRLKHFTRQPSQNENEIRIPVGFGTGCDTKFDKPYTLVMPVWVYEKIRIYIKSPRALDRRDKAKHIFEDEPMQYVFLNNRGAPYYVASDDPYRNLYKDPPSGVTVRQFIFCTLKSTLHKMGHSFTFSFHDLRASFIMNLFDKEIPKVLNKEKTLDQVLGDIKTKSGHSSLTVTNRYLNFKDKNKLANEAQDDWEQNIKDMLNWVAI